MRAAVPLLITVVYSGLAACAPIEEDPSPIGGNAMEIVSDIDGAAMVLVPAGTFQMGSLVGDADEQPVHTVYLNAFYMDVYEVTNARYQQFVEQSGYAYPSLWHNPRFNAPDAPVVGVKWREAAAYAAWAGKRLPTEAEWEYAARGSLPGKIYPNGDIMNRADANFSGTGGVDRWKWTAPVGSFNPNGYNLYDMAGNVWEWCRDTRPGENGAGGSKRLVHGGSFLSQAERAVIDFRHFLAPERAHTSIGFRLVQVPGPLKG